MIHFKGMLDPKSHGPSCKPLLFYLGIREVEICMHPQMYMKEPRSIPLHFGANIHIAMKY